jgi:CheY-like chemotaxis protein
MAKPKIPVLVAEDNQDDRFFIERAASGLTRLNIVAWSKDGHETVEYLSDAKKGEIPEVLLLDLRMPRKDGFQVLEWLKEKKLPRLLVVILSDSDNEADIHRALSLGADYYKLKPGDLRMWRTMLLVLEAYAARERGEL